MTRLLVVGPATHQHMTMHLSETVPAKYLRELRLAAGMTQGELAQAVGQSQSRISRLETGSGTATSTELTRLADACRAQIAIRLRNFQRLVASGQIIESNKEPASSNSRVFGMMGLPPSCKRKLDR